MYYKREREKIGKDEVAHAKKISWLESGSSEGIRNQKGLRVRREETE